MTYSSWCTVHIPPWYKPYTGGMRVVFLSCGGNSVRVPRTYAHQSIHAQTIISFVFQEHSLTSASMLKPYILSCSKSIREPVHLCPRWEFRSCSKNMRSPEHPCSNHTSFRVPRAYGRQSIYGQTIIPYLFQEHTVTGASMAKP